jgi:hypothetical protein
MNEFEPAAKHHVAQSWWITSELARRHPHLFIVEHHPMDGFYNSLGLVDLNVEKSTVVVDVNRPGSVHVHHGAKMEPISLTEALSFDNAHEVVKRVEIATRWGAPKATPQTTARTLTYRVIARVLASMVNDRHQWDVVTEWDDGSWSDSSSNGHFANIPLAHHLLSTAPSVGVFGEPWVHFWALQRDGETIAMLDTTGRVATASGCRDLLPSYRNYNGSLTRVIADALGDVLP